MNMVTTKKWSGKDIVTFLDLFRNYPCLWDASSADYINRNAKDAAYNELLKRLEERGLKSALSPLKKKIKSLRDTYRNEVNKVKKSIKKGAGPDDVYTSRLVWFSAAQMFWSNSIMSLDLSPNLDLTEMELSVLSDETPANKSIRSNTASLSKKEKYSTSAISCNKAAKRSPEKMLPSSCYLKRFKTTSGSKKPQSHFEKTVENLQDINELSQGKEDQYDKYGQYIASQLREMPLRSFICLQSQINNLITTERLNCLDAEQGQSSMQS